jgi:hypothetical protein
MRVVISVCSGCVVGEDFRIIVGVCSGWLAQPSYDEPDILAGHLTCNVLEYYTADLLLAYS